MTSKEVCSCGNPNCTTAVDAEKFGSEIAAGVSAVIFGEGVECQAIIHISPKDRVLHITVTDGEDSFKLHVEQGTALFETVKAEHEAKMATKN